MKLYSSVFHVSLHLAILAFLAEKLLQRPLASLTFLGTRREGQEAGHGDFRCPNSLMEKKQGQVVCRRNRLQLFAGAMLPPSGALWRHRTGAKLHSSWSSSVSTRGKDSGSDLCAPFPSKNHVKNWKRWGIKVPKHPVSGGGGRGAGPKAGT